MKTCLLLLALLYAQGMLAQKTKLNLANSPAAPERKAILAVMRKTVAPSLRLQPKFVVRELNLMGGFAFFQGGARRPDGGPIDFRKTAYREDLAQGMFDGEATAALLKRKGTSWTVLAWVIGATDVPWGCWWKEFKAPRAIFSYTENCQQ